eukprot:178411-Rhodomonas_salina.4
MRLAFPTCAGCEIRDAPDLDLALPVLEHRERTHDQRRPRPPLPALPSSEHRAASSSSSSLLMPVHALSTLRRICRYLPSHTCTSSQSLSPHLTTNKEEEKRDIKNKCATYERPHRLCQHRTLHSSRVGQYRRIPVPGTAQRRRRAIAGLPYLLVVERRRCYELRYDQRQHYQMRFVSTRYPVALA